MAQAKIPCVIMRGGTSKAVFFKEEDLPGGREAREQILLAAFGSPDPRQIDGLGGADPTTSKCAIVSLSKEPGIDVHYTFAQVAIDRPFVDWRGNCGNISSAVAHGIIDAAAATGVPMTFGVLTTNSVEEALERAGAKSANKGWEAAMAAVEMATLTRVLKKQRTLE